MIDTAAVLLLAVAMDLGLGDPPNAVHPVAWLGRLASALTARLPRAPRGRAFVAGVLLAGIVTSSALAVAVGCVRLLDLAPTWIRIVVEAALLKSTFALRGLLDAGRALVDAFEREGLDAARARLSWLCSRDASRLDAEGLANGTVESLAENLSDSVVAPLFYFVLLGLPGAAIYRAVNTLDAMVGYRGELEWLGKFSARADDLLNLVPARLTALALLVAAPSVQGDLRTGLRIHRRDHALTESPNSGHPMAMAAGLLGLRLDKPGSYVLGEELRAPTMEDVSRAASLVRAAALVFVVAASVGMVTLG